MNGNVKINGHIDLSDAVNAFIDNTELYSPTGNPKYVIDRYSDKVKQGYCGAWFLNKPKECIFQENEDILHYIDRLSEYISYNWNKEDFVIDFVNISLENTVTREPVDNCDHRGTTHPYGVLNW
ncbi:MAG: hypothetical protein LBT91_02705 [Bifidobacteriaceae bacterium]|jgi:hypothetical protein|nr:hypothetical protein [Bifidobacteriaceae bacterium]